MAQKGGAVLVERVLPTARVLVSHREPAMHLGVTRVEEERVLAKLPELVPLLRVLQVLEQLVHRLAVVLIEPYDVAQPRQRVRRPAVLLEPLVQEQERLLLLRVDSPG